MFMLINIGCEVAKVAENSEYVIVEAEGQMTCFQCDHYFSQNLDAFKVHTLLQSQGWRKAGTLDWEGCLPENVGGAFIAKDEQQRHGCKSNTPGEQTEQPGEQSEKPFMSAVPFS